jgi:hypothetical protein
VYNDQQTINVVIERVMAVDLGAIERQVMDRQRRPVRRHPPRSSRHGSGSATRGSASARGNFQDGFRRPPARARTAEPDSNTREALANVLRA